MVYKGKAGTAGPTPKSWPANELVSLPSNKPVLVMFAHPQCPCTKASLGELESLVAKGKDRFDAAVVFYQPPGASLEWSNTVLIGTARAIPGVRVIFDRGATAAKQFGAETSGHTVLYASDGRLLFSGGITASRGHLGDNAGFDAILKLVKDDVIKSKVRSTPVFGCSLLDTCGGTATKMNLNAKTPRTQSSRSTD